MRRNGQTSRFVSQVTDFQRGSSFQIRQDSSNAQEVSFRGGDFNPGNNQKIVDRPAICAHEAYMPKWRAREMRAFATDRVLETTRIGARPLPLREGLGEG